MADRASVLVMVADTGDMDMGWDMDTIMDMAIAGGDLRGLRPPPFFKNFSCEMWCFVALSCTAAAPRH